MWNRIEKHFVGLPAQLKIAKLLFERGFQVRDDGKVASGRISIAHSQIASAVGVERRAVDNLVHTILSNPELRRIFGNLSQVCSLREVAREFNLGVIIFIPTDPHAADIIASVTKKISQRGLSIRQALAEDPDLRAQAKLTIIVDGNIPPELIDEIRKIPGTRSVTVY